MSVDEEKLVNAFLLAHAVVYPDEQELRDSLEGFKLEADAKALLAHGLASDAIEEIIGREMQGRIGLNQGAPRTIRFCANAVAAGAKTTKVVSFVRRAPSGPAPAELLPRQSVPYSKLTEAERWCWHARMRAFRASIDSDPDANDPGRAYFDAGLLRQAEAERVRLRGKVFTG